MRVLRRLRQALANWRIKRMLRHLVKPGAKRTIVSYEFDSFDPLTCTDVVDKPPRKRVLHLMDDAPDDKHNS